MFRGFGHKHDRLIQVLWPPARKSYLPLYVIGFVNLCASGPSWKPFSFLLLKYKQEGCFFTSTDFLLLFNELLVCFFFCVCLLNVDHIFRAAHARSCAKLIAQPCASPSEPAENNRSPGVGRSRSAPCTAPITCTSFVCKRLAVWGFLLFS